MFTPTPPEIVENLQYFSGDGAINLTWDRPLNYNEVYINHYSITKHHNSNWC